MRGWGSPNSDDGRRSLALCLLCVSNLILSSLHAVTVFLPPPFSPHLFVTSISPSLHIQYINQSLQLTRTSPTLPTSNRYSPSPIILTLLPFLSQHTASSPFLPFFPTAQPLTRNPPLHSLECGKLANVLCSIQTVRQSCIHAHKACVNIPSPSILTACCEAFLHRHSASLRMYFLIPQSYLRFRLRYTASFRRIPQIYTICLLPLLPLLSLAFLLIFHFPFCAPSYTPPLSAYILIPYVPICPTRYRYLCIFSAFPHTSSFLILFTLISFLFRHSASLRTLYFFIPQSS